MEWVVTYVIDSIMKSPYWNSTAIILTWDDYGSFYDHVPPTTNRQTCLGFRMPAIIIYPYAKPGILIMAVPITINAKIHRMAL